MFSILVLILQVAMLITTFITLPLLFIIRIYTAIKNKIDIKESLLIILLPFSFGYYFYLKKDQRAKSYNVLIVIFLIIAIIGILFTLYQRLIPTF